jgi:RNA polymerase sigma-70 factor, ECF subfamily
VIALNRAVAIGELRGFAAGLDTLDSLDVTQLEDYQPCHAARADLLARAGGVMKHTPPTPAPSS